ncbi:MAG: hypothetical protein JXA82_18235 [Sedimentisphaerales bacterium]|nr:hypothetical protein [Sedimentisphaerales bacterium]
MTPKFSGHIENGHPVIDDPRFESYCAQWKDDTPVEVIVRKKRKPVSNNQLRYLYGVVYKIIADHTGHTIEEIDAMMKWKFLRSVDSNGLEYVPSKLDNSTIEQEDYHRKIRDWAAMALDLNIPLPHEERIELQRHIRVA